MSQSDGLSERLKKLYIDDKTLVDDSKISEKTLTIALQKLKIYVSNKIKKIFSNGILEIISSITLYDLKMYQYNENNCFPFPIESDKNKSLKPDGGIWFLVINSKKYLLMIVEDKKQGTNDTRFQNKLKKQSTGNAIERFAKNVRACEMLSCNIDIFPYIIFASGCDFHQTETISDRLVIGNYGFPNHCISINKNTNQINILFHIISILKKINIYKINYKCIVSIFIKTHKWDEMGHNSSDWNISEIYDLSKCIIDKSIEYYKIKLNI